MSHFGNTRNISNFLISVIFVIGSVTSDPWCCYYDLLKAQRMGGIFFFLVVKEFLIKARAFFSSPKTYIYIYSFKRYMFRYMFITRVPMVISSFNLIAGGLFQLFPF